MRNLREKMKWFPNTLISIPGMIRGVVHDEDRWTPLSIRQLLQLSHRRLAPPLEDLPKVR